MEDAYTSLVPKYYTPKQREEYFAHKRQELATDLASALRFAGHILVRCETCQDAPASFRPLECFTLRPGLDSASADYVCENGHVSANVPLSVLAGVALTTIQKANKSARNRVETVALVGDYL